MVVLMEDDEVKVGDRVEVTGDRGKVLYVGPVPPSKGTWVGIDWDDPARGKHNGTNAGITYFKARYETSGSLVRLEKLSPRQSIVSAIVERYDGADIDLDSDTVHQIEKAIKAPFLMLVGFDKVADKQSYNCLKIVGLRGMRVTGPGEPDQLATLCPHIEELDLAKNLMNSWDCIAKITSQCPNLTFLDLSENRLKYGENIESLKTAFSKLEYLVLSRVEYTWDDILHCAHMWPQIQKLQVSYNRITSLSTPQADIFKDLTLLSLEGNCITDWNEILKLGRLKNLEILNASQTGISEVWFPTPNNLFKSLQYILLSGNFISRWECVNELNKLPCLNEVKFRDNPVLNGLTRETARQILIARLHKIKILNGQEVCSDERRGAEYDYLKQNAKAWHLAKSDLEKKDSFITLHPSYQNLVSVYGEIDESEFEVKSSAIKNKLVTVTIKLGDKSISKKLPLNMSVQKLNTLLQRLFHDDCNRLMLVSSKNPQLKVPLEDEMKDLAFYSLEEGDNILIQT